MCCVLLVVCCSMFWQLFLTCATMLFDFFAVMVDGSHVRRGVCCVLAGVCCLLFVG